MLGNVGEGCIFIAGVDDLVSTEEHVALDPTPVGLLRLLEHPLDQSWIVDPEVGEGSILHPVRLGSKSSCGSVELSSLTILIKED